MATRLRYHCGWVSLPPFDATTTTSCPSVMYTNGETTVLPDFRPVCSSSNVGTGFFSPAPTRQLAPILPPDFRYTHTCALPAYFMAVVTNGEFSCAGFLFGSISPPRGTVPFFRRRPPP